MKGRVFHRYQAVRRKESIIDPRAAYEIRNGSISLLKPKRVGILWWARTEFEHLSELSLPPDLEAKVWGREENGSGNCDLRGTNFNQVFCIFGEVDEFAEEVIRAARM